MDAYSLSGPSVSFIDMAPQSKAQAQALAESVLAECKAPQEAAPAIARATYTTPLVTVLAAQLVARDSISLELLGNEVEFRTYVLSCLQDVITASLVTGQDVQKLKAVLRVIALLQPVIPDEPGLLDILLRTEGVSHSDAGRLMRLLGEAGVLFKRGLRSRLAPDLLADEVIRSNYLDTDGRANEDVTKVFNLAGATQLKNMFVNLGRLDWRLREGKTDDSVLLTSLGPKLRWGDQYSHPHVEAVEAIAYYQPRFALDFAKRLIAEGHGDSASVCNIVRYAAYTYDHVQEACQLLWSAGRNDTRELHQQPSHGIRILKELAELQLNKPLEYVRQVVRFALELLERPASLNTRYTPFSILEGALKTEMESRSVSRLTITITRYRLPLEWAGKVREEITNALLKYVRTGPPRRAFLSALTIAQALRGPMHGDDSDNAWRQQQAELLRKLRAILEEINVQPMVVVRLAQSVAWHAFHGGPETSAEAQAILAMLDRDLRTRLIRTLVDGWGHDTWRFSESLEREEHVAERARLTVDLIAAFPDPASLLDELDSALHEMSAIANGQYGSPFLFVNHLMGSMPGLAAELLRRNSKDRASLLGGYVGVALSTVMTTGDSTLVNEYAVKAESSANVLAQLAEAYARFEPARAYTAEEVHLFQRIFQSKDPTVLDYASSLVRQIANRSPALAVELICLADFEVNERATHDMFLWLSGENLIPEADIASMREKLLNKLVTLKNLDDYWVRTFLVKSIKKAPDAVVKFVRARLTQAKRQNDWSYQALRKEHGGEGLDLMNVEAGPRLLRDLLDSSLEQSNDVLFSRLLGETVAGLCGRYDKALLDLLLDWVSSGGLGHARLAACVLQESQPELIYEHSKFIRNILDAAELIGDEALDEVRSGIAAAAHSGVRSGTPGEPFPADIKLEEHCEQMLRSLSRVDPAYELYEGLLRDARYAIARERKSKEAYEDDYE